METMEQSSKTQLDTSNERLRKAFIRLQHNIEQRLVAPAQPSGESPESDLLIQENQQLREKNQQLLQEYASLKQASTEAFMHLNHSIDQLERLIARESDEA